MSSLTVALYGEVPVVSLPSTRAKVHGLRVELVCGGGHGRATLQTHDCVSIEIINFLPCTLQLLVVYGVRQSRSYPEHPLSRLNDSRFERFGCYLLLVLAVLFWAGNWVVGRLAREDISPGLLTLGRMLVVVIVLAPIAARESLRKFLRAAPAPRRILLVISLLGGGLHNVLQYLGMHYSIATNGAILNSVTPAFVMLLAYFALGERITAQQIVGFLVSLCGVLCIATDGNWRQLVSFRLNPGDVLIVVSLFMVAAFTVLLRKRSDNLSPLQLLWLVAAIGALSLLPWVLAEMALGAAVLRYNATSFWSVMYAGFAAALLAFYGWNQAVARLGAARTSIFMHLVPAFGVILAALFVNERPRWFHFVGIAVILAGLALATSSRLPDRSPSPRRA